MSKSLKLTWVKEVKMDNEKSEIFLSYFSEEIRPARILKHTIKKAFSYEFEVFMSSENIQHGQDWFQEIGKALKQCKIIILFCSPISVKKEWMHFEAGCAHSLGIPIITICHSGLKVKDLPSNLTRFHNAEITEDIEVLKKLFKDIQNRLEYKKQLSIDYQKFLDEMNDEKNNIIIDEIGVEIYEGNWKNGKKHGEGTRKFLKKTKKFKSSKTYDNVKIVSKYIGTWKDGKKHGYGKYMRKGIDTTLYDRSQFQFRTGREEDNYRVNYEGNFENDSIKDGTCVFTFNNGCQYKGKCRQWGIPIDRKSYVETYNRTSCK